MYLGKINELIEFLQIIQAQYGDVGVQNLKFDGEAYSIDMIKRQKRRKSDLIFNGEEFLKKD